MDKLKKYGKNILINDYEKSVLLRYEIDITKCKTLDEIILLIDRIINELSDEEQKYNEARVLINPVIIERIGLTRYWENCASCLDNMGLVERPYKIVVEYLDIEGNLHKDIFEGFESTVLSHEMDHLDGILHMDIALEIKNMPKEERKIFRQTHGYEILSKTSKWQEKRIRTKR